MRFAVGLIRLLCAVIAGAVLVAFLYFLGQGAEYHTATMVFMVLFVITLLIWALIAAIGDGWLKKVNDNNFYQKITNKPDNKAIEAFIAASMDKITDKVSQDDEAKHQVLLSEFHTLNEKIGALNMPILAEKTEVADNLEELRIVVENMQRLEVQIAKLHDVVEAQMKTIEAMVQNSGQWENAPKVYPKLTEEATYPESVIDYAQEENNFAPEDYTSEQADTIVEEQFAKSKVEETFSDESLERVSESDASDNVLVEPTAEKTDYIDEDEQVAIDEPLDSFLTDDISLEEKSDEDGNTASEDNGFEIPADLLPEEEVKIDLGADDPFGSAVELTPAEDVDIVAETEADTALDLGADDPFGASVEVVADTKEEPVFEPEHHTIDLGADNPFGTSVDVGSPVDIDAIEPAANVKKNEPNLDHIFNDELASELADLEILHDKNDDNKDDLDLEQFFAGHRKSLG